MNKKLPMRYLILFIVSIGLLLTTTISGARASLISSDRYDTEFKMKDIGITLIENEEPVGHRDFDVDDPDYWDEEATELLTDIDEPVKLGYTYTEECKVKNSGTIPEFVRVIVYKYWIDKDGNKYDWTDSNKETVQPNGKFIELTLTCSGEDHFGWLFGNSESDWIYDESNSTQERAILYYKNILPVDEETPLFMNKLKINKDIADQFTVKTDVIEDESGKYTQIEYSYLYNGSRFCVKVVADAVQTHNAADAIKSTWGRGVEVDGGVLSLSAE